MAAGSLISPSPNSIPTAPGWYTPLTWVEAAWNNRSPVRISRTILARQQGLPKAVTQTAWNAQIRLYHRYKHLIAVGRKKSQVAAAALGRELTGFIWAIGRMVKPRPVKN